MAIVHVAPQAGAAFTMMTVELEPGGVVTEGPTQRFLYVLEGELALREPGKTGPHAMNAGGYAYLPTDYEYKLEAQTKARIAVIDKPFLPLTPAHGEELPGPCFLIGREAEVASVSLNGDEGLQVRSLLPDSLAFAFTLVSEGTEAQGAQLLVEVVPAAGVCRVCGEETELEGFPFACACGSFDLEIVRGEELLVDAVTMMETAHG